MPQSSSNRFPFFKVVFFAIIAVLLLSELVLSNIGTLFGDLEGIAQRAGLSNQAEVIRLLILIVLDAIGGVGAVLATWGYTRPDARKVGGIGVQLCTVGLLLYGIYQFFSGLFQLSAEFAVGVMAVGVVYLLFGIVAWFLGGDLRRG